MKQQEEEKLKQELQEKQELMKKARDVKDKFASVTSDTKKKVAASASSVKIDDKLSSVSEGLKSIKNVNVKPPTITLPTVDVQVPSVNIPKVNVNVTPPKIPSNIDVKNVKVPSYSSIQSLSEDTINTGVGIASASIVSLLALRNSKVAREKAQAKAEAEEELKKLEEAKKNRLDVKALEVSKDVFETVDTQVTKVSKDFGEKLKKNLKVDADVDEETLGKAVVSNVITVSHLRF